VAYRWRGAAGVNEDYLAQWAISGLFIGLTGGMNILKHRDDARGETDDRDSRVTFHSVMGAALLQLWRGRL